MSRYYWLQAGGIDSNRYAFEWAYKDPKCKPERITGVSRCMFCKRFLPIECHEYNEYGKNCETQDAPKDCHHLSCKNEICQVKAALSGRSWW